MYLALYIHVHPFQEKNLLSQEFQDWLKSTVGNKMKCIGNSNKLTIPMDQELKENVAFWQEFQHQKRKKRKSDGKDMYADHSREDRHTTSDASGYMPDHKGFGPDSKNQMFGNDQNGPKNSKGDQNNEVSTKIVFLL